MMSLCPATEVDLHGILSIFNEVIANSTAVYSEAPSTPEDRAAWLKARRELGYPVLVGEDDTGITGFATFGDFRPWHFYRFTVAPISAAKAWAPSSSGR